MGLTSDIQSIIESTYPDATFMLSSKFNANLESLSIQITAFPLIILDNELPQEAEIKKNANVQKNSKIVISFLTLDDKENTDVQSNTLMESMRAYADRVAVQIFQLDEVRPIGPGNQKYKTTPLFHVFNSDLTGVALEMVANYNEIVIFNSC